MNKVMQFRQATEDTTEILIYGDIREQDLFDVLIGETGTRVGAYDFRSNLENVKTPNVTVRINSNGGSVKEGLAIYNLLRSCGLNVTTICDGFACSAASIIYCAGTKRIQPKTALLMIHKAWTNGGDGNADDFRRLAEELDEITQPSIEAYKDATGLTEEKIKELMEGSGSWLQAEKALSLGFTTEIPGEDTKQYSEYQKEIFDLVKKVDELQIINDAAASKIEELKKNQKEPTPERIPEKDISEAFKKIFS